MRARLTQPTRVRGGFTLAEVLVVLAILAVLAAVLVPAILGQLRKGDISRVAADLDATRVGIETFVSDVHRYPGTLDHLTTALSGTSEDILGNTYPPGLAARWDGPYLNKVLVGGVLATGFAGSILDTLRSNTNSNGINYVTVLITGIAAEDFDDIDEIIDGTAGSSTGQLRFIDAAVDTIKYMAVPIN